MGATIVGIGNLSQEPKMSYTPGGTAQTRINVAVHTGFGDKEKTVWFSLVCWGTFAEMLNEKLVKGSKISFCAELTGIYVSESGNASINAKVLTVEFLSKTSKSEKGGSPFDQQEEVEEF